MSFKSKHITRWNKILVNYGFQTLIFDLNSDGSLKKKFPKHPPRNFHSIYLKINNQQESSQNVPIVSLSTQLNANEFSRTEPKDHFFKIPPISSIIEKIDSSDVFNVDQNFPSLSLECTSFDLNNNINNIPLEV